MGSFFKVTFALSSIKKAAVKETKQTALYQVQVKLPDKVSYVDGLVFPSYKPSKQNKRPKVMAGSNLVWSNVPMPMSQKKTRLFSIKVKVDGTFAAPLR